MADRARPAGSHGRYLRIDPRPGRAGCVPIPAEVARLLIGGVGLGTWLVARENPPGVAPLAPDAALAFALSPLVGSPLTTSAKFAVVALSPLTGRICDALSSSHFALAAKRAGVDALVLAGAWPEPVVLAVDGQGRDEPVFEALPAGDLWGLPAAEAERAVRARLGPDWQVAAIGPAGEARIPFATLSHDGRHAGRGGLGAVLGAKNVKALAVRGDRRTPLADPARVLALARDLSARSFGPATEKYRELGTVANLLVFNRFAALPTRNFAAGRMAPAEAERLAPADLDLGPARKVARKSCAACTIGCEHLYAVGGGQRAVGSPEGARGGGRRLGGSDALSELLPDLPTAHHPPPTVRLEYESLYALGPLCGVSDPEAVLAAAARCDALGLDTITTGGTLAFLMDAAERGWVDATLPSGRVLRFGDGAAVVEAIDLIPGRRGLGALAALGSRGAAEVLGGAAPAHAMHVKGLELPGYDPRALHAMALGLAVGTRGADHNRSAAYEVDFSGRADRRRGGPETAAPVLDAEDRAAALDCLILCKFLRGVFTDFWAEASELLAAVTGGGQSAENLRRSARAVVDLRHLVNERAGWTAAEDTLPPRLLADADPGPDDPPALSRARLAAMVAAYYRLRGRDEAGRLAPARRAELERLIRTPAEAAIGVP